MRTALAHDAVILPFCNTSKRAIALAAARHNRMRRLVKWLFRNDLPLDAGDAAIALRLGADAHELWSRLTIQIWEYGSLPHNPGGRAPIANVTRRKWERHGPSLEPLFRRDWFGAWTHDGLAAARKNMVARFDATEAGRSPNLRSVEISTLAHRSQLIIGLGAEMSAQFELDARCLRAWRMLLLHLLEHGRLPPGRKALADICEMRATSFAALEDRIGRHFDRGADASWTHDDVMAGRGRRPKPHSTVVLGDDRNCA